jgi:methionyl-tRNA formyltransferase
MRILCVGYRDWALEIYRGIDLHAHDHLIIDSEEEFSTETIEKFDPELILFYGWSQIIPRSVTSEYKCLMLHPSPLPFYRGGSPIQNQIIRNESKSAVTIFIMDDGIDTGSILAQEEISLADSLSHVFSRIVEVGIKLTNEILAGFCEPHKQVKAEGSYYSRRNPELSEITDDELDSQSARFLFNKIRMLQDPYPEPFYVCSDGKKMLFKVIIEG